MTGRWLAVAAGVLARVRGGASAEAQEALRVGFVSIGPVADYGWSYLDRLVEGVVGAIPR